MVCSNSLRFALVCLLALSACKRIEKDTPPVIFAVIDSLRQEHCPDRRLCVYEIDVIMRGANLKLIGEISDREVKSRVVQAVKHAAPHFKVEEEIRLLPEDALGLQRFGLVRVSVANMRKQPLHSAELVHQQLMGSSVQLLKQDGNWCYVRAEDDYLGWMPEGGLKIGGEDLIQGWQDSQRVGFTALHGTLRSKADEKSLAISSLVLGCTLQVTDTTTLRSPKASDKWIKVKLPDGRVGYVERHLVVLLGELFPTAPLASQRVVESAIQMLGIAYLWGGTSTNGFDCSGFTQTVFRLNGVRILRDASQQARYGELVEPGSRFERLEPGDLLFFGEKEGKITHVAISLGGAQMIHASDFVQINSLDERDDNYSDYRRRTFQFARRYLPGSVAGGETRQAVD